MGLAGGPSRHYPAGTEFTSDEVPALHWQPLDDVAWRAWLTAVNTRPLFRELNMPSFEIPAHIREQMTTRRGWNE